MSMSLQAKNRTSVSILFEIILLGDLNQITPTCQFLKDDTLFFEVLAKS